MKKDLLKMMDLSRDEILHILDAGGSAQIQTRNTAFPTRSLRARAWA